MSVLSPPNHNRDDSIDQSFPKRVRLRTRRQFLRAQREGSRYSSGSFFAYIKASRGEVRLGITASKKVGKAHDRNRYKRLTREAFRQSRLRHLKGYDVVVVIKQGSPPAQLSALIEELERLTTRLEEGSFSVSKPKKKSAGRRSGRGPNSARRAASRPPASPVETR